MSRVYVYSIDRRGHVVLGEEASNVHTFHVAIWQHLAVKRGLITAADHIMIPIGGPRPQIYRLWASIGTLPRQDGLALAATFDRCWFPVEMRDETAAALEVAEGWAPTAPEVARILREWRPDRRDRGFTFGSSLADAWYCAGGERLHELSRDGRRCRRCGIADVQIASEIVARKAAP